MDNILETIVSLIQFRPTCKLEEGVKWYYCQRFVPDIVNHYFHDCDHDNGRSFFFFFFFLAAQELMTFLINSCTAVIQSNLVYRPPVYKENLLIETTFFRSSGVYVSFYSMQRPPVYKDHILLVPRVAFIYKFYCTCII